MTEQEKAIKDLQNCGEDCDCSGCMFNMENGCVITELESLKEARKKQISMKPELLNEEEYICPVCGEYLFSVNDLDSEEEPRYEYCCECGQKLDGV